MQESKARAQRKFFKTTMVPGKADSGKLFERKLVVADDVSTGSDKPGSIRCLGMTFDSEDARRAYFLERLKAQLPDLRERPDFPTAEDEDILRLSDPPYYTACPNPFVGDFINEYKKCFDPATDDYHRKPFASDVREGKNHPIYNAHSYHTKVPHKAIMRYVLHYTDPGDVIFDGFCGTGMTGVAAALCENANRDAGLNSMSTSNDGQRYVILSDLSPIATFIASNLLRPIHRRDFLKAVEEVCSDIDNEFGYLYLTNHSGWRVRDRKNVTHKHYQHRCNHKGNVEFTLYSDVVRCPECVSETTLYNLAVDEQNDSFRSKPKCPFCNALVQKSKWEPAYTTCFDSVLKQTVRQLRIEPVLINYSVGATRYEKLPDDHDKQLISTASDLLVSHGLAPVRLIDGKETQRNAPIGITHLHHFFTPREHLFVATLLRKIQKYPNNNIRLMLLFSLTASLPYTSRMRRFRADRKGGGPLSGTLYMGSIITPLHVLNTFRRNASTIANGLNPPIDPKRGHIVSTQDAGSLYQVPDSSVDYIFTDPPFGHNFDYSELNFFWEGLIGVVTNQKTEAIVSTSQKKDIDDYRELMERSFTEYYRILKPGRWLTVEFSNTKASVWNALQSALEKSGFVVANVASLDKKQHTFKAIMTPSAVKQDLVISAYKPNGGLEDRFLLESGTEEGVWDFVKTHLNQLPVFVSKHGRAEVVPERQNYLLFDRMVAFHVLRGVLVPLSAAEFYEALSRRLPERDGMYFLPEQVVEYDRKRIKAKEILQLSLFVRNEETAIQWLRQQLTRKPQTFQDIHPQFLKKLDGWQKHEKILELSLLLGENFLRYGGDSNVPTQIHSYLSSNFKEFRNLATDNSTLKAIAKDRWYVPDPKQVGDLVELRERALLREFKEYRESRQRRLKVFRLEAVRAGFRKAWQDQDYATVIAVARKIPDPILYEDPKLLMWYDQALTRTGDTS